MRNLVFHRVFLLLPLIVLMGCSGDSGNRISGKVTFNGKPVPAGKIYFTPDGTKGNTGAPGYANIKNGEYDTGATGGVGAIKGAMKVVIEGLDPGTPGDVTKGDTSGEVTVKTLFASYETTLDVTGTMTKDFDVPADAVKGPKKTESSVIVP